MARDGTCGGSRRSGGTSATRGFLCRELQRRSKEAAGITERQSSGAGAAEVLVLGRARFQPQFDRRTTNVYSLREDLAGLQKDEQNPVSLLVLYLTCH